jgi:hypothetical protein
LQFGLRFCHVDLHNFACLPLCEVESRNADTVDHHCETIARLLDDDRQIPSYSEWQSASSLFRAPFAIVASISDDATLGLPWV